jgi:hypothetical protein
MPDWKNVPAHIKSLVAADYEFSRPASRCHGEGRCVATFAVHKDDCFNQNIKPVYEILMRKNADNKYIVLEEIISHPTFMLDENFKKIPLRRIPVPS